MASTDRRIRFIGMNEEKLTYLEKYLTNPTVELQTLTDGTGKNYLGDLALSYTRITGKQYREQNEKKHTSSAKGSTLLIEKM